MPTWPFIHPWIAASAAALAALPIIIHVLNRRRYRRVVWAAMSFLAAAQRRNARRVRIEQLILLALRCLIMLLIALAIARPLLAPAGLGAVGQAAHHHIIILDDSYSMGMLDAENEPAFSRARDLARRLVAGANRGDAVSVILAGESARALIERGSYDRQAVDGVLEQCTVGHGATDLAGAFDLAADILDESELPAANRTTLVMTDATKQAWLGDGPEPPKAIVSAAERVAEGSRLIIVDVAPPDRPNLSLVSLVPSGPVLAAEWPVTLSAEVANRTRQEVRGLRLQVDLDGEALRVASVPAVAPGETEGVRFRVDLGRAGSHVLRARLLNETDDVLPVDGERWLALHLRREVPVLLVDGRPGADPFAGQTGYLAAALAPKTAPTDRTFAEPRIILPGELPSEALGDYALIGLCNVRQLEPGLWLRLTEAVRQGVGLLVAMGDQVNQADYNRHGFADGDGVLPARVEGIVGSEEDPDVFVRISPENLSHPAVADFAGHPKSGLFLARFQRYARLNVPPELPGADVVLRFDNGETAMATRRFGAGRVVMLAFTANMDWTNLPAKGDYVSLMMNLLAWACGQSATERNLTVGETGAVPLDARSASLSGSVVGPDGRRRSLIVTTQPASTRPLAKIDDVRRAGRYRLELGPRTLDVAANLEAAEGDLTAIGPEELRDALPLEFEFVRERDDGELLADAGSRREFGWMLLWVVLALLLIETFLAMWFGHHRD